MKHFSRTFRPHKYYFAALLFCFLCTTIHAKTTDDHDDKGIHYEVEIDYPVFEKEPLLNAQIADIVQKTLNSFNKDFFSAEMPLYPQAFECVIDNSSVYEDMSHISFILKVYQYAGGAHGITTLVPVTFSKETKKLLSLKEAVQPAQKNWLVALSTEARRLLNEQIKQGSLSSNQSWITKGTEPEAENFAVFKLEKNAVRIIFSQYQVAPYSSGMPEIVIPLTFFK